jgi:mannan endo-1,4-beta-mannosidase
VGSIDFGYDNSTIDSAVYPREMIPRMLGWIATAYASNSAMAPGYSISEYDMGCDAQIEGGVAQADLLGVFGREGLFGATMWPLTTVAATDGTLANYSVAAFDLYRNYDGNGGTVGDTAVSATTSDVPDTSVYAFTNSTHAGQIDVVAINKLGSATSVTLTLAHAPPLTTVSLYHLVDGTIGVTAMAGSPSVTCSGGTCTIEYTMPPTSATTMVLR